MIVGSFASCTVVQWSREIARSKVCDVHMLQPAGCSCAMVTGPRQIDSIVHQSASQSVILSWLLVRDGGPRQIDSIVHQSASQSVILSWLLVRDGGPRQIDSIVHQSASQSVYIRLQTFLHFQLLSCDVTAQLPGPEKLQLWVC
jgi:hypothetical protein